MFETQVLPDGQYQVRLPVNIASNGTRAKIAVGGSGTYDGTLRRTNSNGAEYSFRTAVSREVIAVGPGGETAWQIDFNDGGVRGYFGTCGPER
ncbi:hypothetical protein [uncultured Tateyamaria sp.]|uniref:hypothetical protein n=1 Tax=uncultured Tateyamaria sp. TaxID=455651 RepID=UPI00260C76D1|nr:hypothetical protein [uncultured Tateyamaria sp.]